VFACGGYGGWIPGGIHPLSYWRGSVEIRSNYLQPTTRFWKAGRAFALRSICVNTDAPEINARNSQDARFAFEEAKELRRVWHPFLVAHAKERPADGM
jgi:hypothetical protein